MRLFKLKFIRVFSVIVVVVLAFGAGSAVSPQQQDNRIYASTEPNPNECNTQVSGRRCCSVTYKGGMCKYTNQGCAGGWIPTNGTYTSWYCPLGNDYVCCQNAEPTVDAGPARTTTLPDNSVTLNGDCNDADTDSRNLESCTWTKETNLAGTIESATSETTVVKDLVEGVYTFKLTATDGYAPKSDTVTVTVNAAETTPTHTPTPTATLVPGTRASLMLFLHGVGKAGDSVLQGEAGGGNMDPLNRNRVVRVELYNAQNQKVKTVNPTVVFDDASGSFKGEVNFGDVTSGNYLVRAKFSQSLDTQIGGIQALTNGAVKSLPAEYLVTGDVNGDGAISLDVLDFNLLIACVNNGSACTEEFRAQANLDDNDKVDLFDFNLFIREISHST